MSRWASRTSFSSSTMSASSLRKNGEMPVSWWTSSTLIFWRNACRHELVALGCGDGERFAQVLRRRGQIGRRVQLARAHRLLERLLEGPADGHGLPHALHVRGELAVGQRELLERPARHLDDDVVECGLEARRRLARDVVVDLVQRVAHGQPGGDLGDREPCGLGGERRAPGDARVHLDDDDFAGLGVHGELHVAAAGGDADLADDRLGGVAQLLVLGVGERERRRDGDAVAGVHAHRVDVLDGADDHDVVGVVAHDLELELVPAYDGLLEEDLRDRAEAQAPARRCARSCRGRRRCRRRSRRACTRGGRRAGGRAPRRRPRPRPWSRPACCAACAGRSRPWRCGTRGGPRRGGWPPRRRRSSRPPRGRARRRP